MTTIAHVNQDRGIRPGSEKGAWVHVQQLRAALEKLGTNVIAIDEPKTARLTAELDRAQAQFELDAVYERYSLGGYATGEWARAHGIPHLLEVNAPLQQEAAQHRPESLDAHSVSHEERMFRGATSIFVVSPELRSYALERGADPERVHVTPNGVDAERFRPREADSALRSELVPPGRFVIGFHGRLRPWHHFDVLCDAAAALRESGRPIFVLTVGRGDFEEHLSARLPTDSYRCIEWVPHEEVGKYVACFDALPLHYAVEGESYFSPLKLFEAMAAGVVPVVPRVGDLPRHIHDRENGLLYDAGDNPALERCLATLLDEPELWSRVRARAIESASAHSWTKIAAEVIERSRTGCPQ